MKHYYICNVVSFFYVIMLPEEILKHYNLKNTACRKHIISELLNTDVALSENELKDSLAKDLFDRVTFYRSLKILEEKNIIHRIVLHDTSVKYALNKQLLSNNNHVHYHCTKCNEVTCGTESIIENLYSSEKFSVQTADIVLEGLCADCNNKKD